MVRAAAALAVASTLALIAFLPFAGRYLVVEDPLERADAIFVLPERGSSVGSKPPSSIAKAGRRASS
jgi:hypothetical protein